MAVVSVGVRIFQIVVFDKLTVSIDLIRFTVWKMLRSLEEGIDFGSGIQAARRYMPFALILLV